MTKLIAWAQVAIVFAVELVKSTWATILAVIGPQDRLRPAILAIPLDVRSPGGIVLFADMVTLTPGTTSLDVSTDGKTLYVHAIDAPDGHAAIDGMKASLETQARKVLP